MVRLATQDSQEIYLVLDGRAPIGRVVAPAGAPVLGRGAATVLLQRPRGRRPREPRGVGREG